MRIEKTFDVDDKVVASEDISLERIEAWTAEILRRMNDGWVSVEERLPEWENVGEVFRQSVSVLAACGTSISLCYYEELDRDGRTIKRWVSEDGEDYPYRYRITHWMPLPTPPKEDK